MTMPATRDPDAESGPGLIAEVHMYDRGDDYPACERCGDLTRFIMVVGTHADGEPDGEVEIAQCARCIAAFLESIVRVPTPGQTV